MKIRLSKRTEIRLNKAHIETHLHKMKQVMIHKELKGPTCELDGQET